MDIPLRTFQRWKNPKKKTEPRLSPRRFKDEEREEILALLNSEEFVDMTVPEVYHTLLDRGEYYCSISTMYAVLQANKAVKERRDQLKHPEYVKPVLKATAPNQVWSWDITTLNGPCKGINYKLYSILDIYDRSTVGWLLSEKENAALAKVLIEQTCEKHNINKEQLTIHSDRGSPMIAKTTCELLIDLGVIKSVSRPRVSNDNPYSEAQFKTLKYNRTFPKRFGSIQEARQFLREFFEWYNNRHYHSGIAMLTPATIRNGKTEEILEKRKTTLAKAYEKHPERFVRGPSKPKKPPREAWINNPDKKLLKVGA